MKLAKEFSRVLILSSSHISAVNDLVKLAKQYGKERRIEGAEEFSKYLYSEFEPGQTSPSKLTPHLVQVFIGQALKAFKEKHD